MPCFRPITARLYRNEFTGRQAISFGQIPLGFGGCDYKPVQLPCGQCIGCRLERSRKWAMRCVMEASMHKQNCFVTLTYDDEHLPPDGDTWKRDFVLFMKRLRKKYGKVRFFHCGEYGERNGRPHHHAILFGIDFSDRERERGVSWDQECGRSSLCFSSLALSALWSHGFSTVGDCTFESAAYVARYCLKKVTGPAAEEHYNGWPPEYVTMSRRPGIAEAWFRKFGSDVYPDDVCFARGVPCKPPRYFDDLFARQFPAEFATIKAMRERAAELSSEHTSPRLEVKEELVNRRMSQVQRRL